MNVSEAEQSPQWHWPLPKIVSFYRIVPTRLLTEHFEGANYGRIIADREESGYEVQRNWAKAMNKKFHMGLEDLKESK